MQNNQAKTIYLDYMACTPPDPRVVDALTHALCDLSANPHARQHIPGENAHRAVEQARRQIGNLIGCDAKDLLLTSGATEANNQALLGIAAHLKATGRTHILSSAIEHKSILEPLSRLEQQGFDVTYLPVLPCGMVDAPALEKALRPETGLVSLMLVNNETGTINPWVEYGDVLKGSGVITHCDAAQAIGKIPFNVRDLGIDMASFSGQKIYAPQGIGALYVRHDLQKHLSPILFGGAQQNNLRAGTLPVGLSVAFGVACEIAAQEMAEESARLRALRERLLCGLRSAWPNIVINGHSEEKWRIPGCINLRFDGVENEWLVTSTPGLAFSTGSACSNRGEKLSHVIRAITESDNAARQSIRLSFGRFTTEQDIDMAVEQISSTLAEIAKITGLQQEKTA